MNTKGSSVRNESYCQHPPTKKYLVTSDQARNVNTILIKAALRQIYHRYTLKDVVKTLIVIR